MNKSLKNINKRNITMKKRAEKKMKENMKMMNKKNMKNIMKITKEFSKLNC